MSSNKIIQAQFIVNIFGLYDDVQITKELFII